MRSTFVKVSLIVTLGLLAACAQQKPSAPQAKEQQIIGQIPAGSPFAKLRPGMSMQQTHDLIGMPTDAYSHTTGKAFIPFYFGKDSMRMEELYKGQGRITYNGVGIGGSTFNIYQITYDPSEDGYNNR
ncbi:hypothetical protein [Pseudomonas sp. GV071]|jgi:hypothetical protein|uniref:hypothetical protein n=1 Tax=Pseudomonas sp. GV071 TaxID=2135754 RepID=UPI000D3ABE31|nr:hypothetical protein [Pseudomonas sp. GV071]PTQ69133.1 hypothetical protein C8K61_109152 [Pseudomonas sp. GV071]